MYHFCSKTATPLRHKHISSFPVKLQKILIFVEANSSMISSKWAFAASSLSILIKAISHNLPWLSVNKWRPEVWKDQFQFTERSFAACSKYCINAIISTSGVFKGRRARHLPRAPLFGGPPLRCYERKFSLVMMKNLLFTHIMYYKADHK